MVDYVILAVGGAPAGCAGPAPTRIGTGGLALLEPALVLGKKGLDLRT